MPRALAEISSGFRRYWVHVRRIGGRPLETSQAFSIQLGKSLCEDCAGGDLKKHGCRRYACNRRGIAYVRSGKAFQCFDQDKAMKTGRGLPHAAVLSAVVILAASNGYAFTGGSDNGAGSPTAMPDAGNAAPGSSSPGDSGGYNFSDPNFNVSVRKNEMAPEATDEPESSGGQRPPASDSDKSPGYFERIWNDLLNLVGSGD